MARTGEGCESDPGRAAAAPTFTTTLSSDIPCAFHGVKAQARTTESCVRLVVASFSISCVRGKKGTQCERSGYVFGSKKGAPAYAGHSTSSTAGRRFAGTWWSGRFPCL